MAWSGRSNNRNDRNQQRERGRSGYDGPAFHTLGTLYEGGENSKAIFRGTVDAEAVIAGVESALQESAKRGRVRLEIRESKFGRGEAQYYIAAVGCGESNDSQSGRSRFGGRTRSNQEDYDEPVDVDDEPDDQEEEEDQEEEPPPPPRSRAGAPKVTQKQVPPPSNNKPGKKPLGKPPVQQPKGVAKRARKEADWEK